MGSRIRLRIEYVKIQYVNPDHVVYKSDGYNYTQPFQIYVWHTKLTTTTKFLFLQPKS
jgi:hypothetical protein